MPAVLSHYTTFQSFHINPKFINSYISRICNQLEPYFSEVPQNQKSPLIIHTLADAKCYWGTPTKQKSPLTITNLVTVLDNLTVSNIHDDLLFNAQLNTGFTGLLCLGKMTCPDMISLRDYKKVMMCFSIKFYSHIYSFLLPTHKADTTFKGNHIAVKMITGTPNPYPIMECYIKSHNLLFHFHLQLWLKSDGTIPPRSWFLKCLHHYFGSHITGQSLQVGGATARV